MVNWTKMGRIFVPSGEGFFKTHAARPIPYRLNEDVLRIFFSSRDHDDRMLPTFIDVDVRDPAKVVNGPAQPLLQLGEPGTFDDSGVTLGSIVSAPDATRIYYTGWKRRRASITFELSIGVLEWDRRADSYRRVYQGPIVAQDRNHPFLAAGPFVTREDDRYRMWYCSGTGWRFPENGPEPLYTVCHAESSDGLDWSPHDGPVVEYDYEGEVISAPWVVRARGRYHMWYSKRGHATRAEKNYTIGYAESADGLAWHRRDELAGITRSPEGWDSEMVCYPAFYPYEDRVYMFYSGNSVGKGGMGYAVAENFMN
jgi:hypothetical protein